uniref:Peptidase A1 domain-containing protein n=1 Tax=Meloidogyne javanica TaxID=6303 RepID=A0A915M0P9_MELJA
MFAKGLNPADITQLYQAYSNPNPPPVVLIRDPFFTEMLIDGLFSAVGAKIHLEHRPKYIFLQNKLELNSTKEKMQQLVDILYSYEDLLLSLEQLLELIKLPVLSAAILHYLRTFLIREDGVLTEPIPLHYVLIDKIAEKHFNLHERVFKLLCALYDHLSGQNEVAEIIMERQRQIVDRFVNLLFFGMAIPVLEKIVGMFKSGYIDVSLVRYFGIEVLELVEQPYSPQFISALLPIVTNREVFDRATFEKHPIAKEFMLLNCAFQVAFNIGSPNSWLIAKNASFNWNEQGLQRKKVRYNGSSKTSKPLGKKFDFGGPVGNLYTDTLTIDSVQIPQFPFGAVTSGIPSQYQDPSGYDALCPIDGEFGLSPATGTSSLNSLTKSLDKPIVSIFTTKVGTGDDNAGSITFGSENVKNCKPKYSYVPLSERSNWVIGVQSININGQPSLNPLGPTKLKITNSGLYMYGPKKQLDILAKQLGFNVPKDSGTFYTKGSCKEMEKMPNIIINVGDNKKQAQIVLKPKQYMEVN